MQPRIILLYFLIAGFLVVGSMAKKDNFVLKTNHAHFGILSLEVLSPCAKSQTALLTEWKKTFAYDVKYNPDSGYTRETIRAIPTAVQSTEWDNFFIPFYVSLFIFFIYGQRSWYKKFSYKLAIRLIVIAGLCDYTENIFMLLSLNSAEKNIFDTGYSWLVFIPSLTKWLLIVFSLVCFYLFALRPHQAVFFKKLNVQLSVLGKELWKFRIVFIGLFILFAVLNLVPQGEDLVIMINSSPRGIAWFLAVSLVLATLNWYLPKTYDVASSPKPKDGVKALYSSNYDYQPGDDLIKRYIGRLAGSATLLIPAIGIITALQTYHVINFLQAVPPFFLFVLLLFLFIQALRYKWLNVIFFRKGAFSPPVYWLFFCIVAALIVYTFFACNPAAKPSSLILVGLSLFALSVLFLVTVNYRQQFTNNLPFVQLLFCISIAVMLLFLLFNISPICESFIQKERFYSLPVFIAALVFYTFLFSYLLLLGKKHNFHFISLLLILGIITSAGSITGYHKISTVPLNKGRKQDSLRTYIRAWLISRSDEIDKQAHAHKDYPVFFVNAYGGGIRAAAWTAMVVGHMNNLIQKDHAYQHDFEHYVFSFSGASGGTIGFSLLAGARLTYADNPKQDSIFSNDRLAMAVFQHDYLTTDLVGILGRDFWAGSSGTDWWKDRAALNEQSWEDYAEKRGISYGASFKFSWHVGPKMETPLLVSNTFDIDQGTKGVLAPVILSQSDFPGATLLQNLMDNRTDIHLSSAAFLSARFPYVSPTGKFDEYHHFTDGGTVENSGAETSLQLIQVFNSVVKELSKTNPIFNRVKVNVLSIPNEVPMMDSVARTKNLYEATGPIMGILKTITGNAIKADSANRYLMAADTSWHSHYYTMPPLNVRIADGSIAPILPLGWQISDYALRMMDSTVKRRSALDTIKMLFDINFKGTAPPPPDKTRNLAKGH